MPDPRRIAFVCIDPWHAPESDYRPFNYSVRRVQAAVVADPALRHVTTAVIESFEPDVEWFVTKILAFEADLVGFSAYVWSFETMVRIARRLKEERPSVCVVFGGPSARPEMFALAPFRASTQHLDALVKGEGEDTMRALAAAPSLDRASLSDIAGLHLPGDEPGTFVATAARALPALDALASPYELGLVGPTPTGHLETYRGCPLSCSFCQWGDLESQSRTFPEAAIRRDLAAFERLGVQGVYLVDAALNLNPRAFRHLRSAFSDSGLKGRARFRTEVYPAHMTDDHLRFLEEVQTENVGIGLQSFAPEVLKGVERPFDASRFERVVSDVASIVRETVVEIILGLPGDSPDSFRRTLDRARQLRAEVRVFRCLVLPGALMSRAPAHHALDFDPHTLELQSCLGWPGDAIEQTCRWVEDEALAVGGERNGRSTWRFPRRDAPGRIGGRDLETGARVPEIDAAPGPLAASDTSVAPAVQTVLEEAIGRASGARWRLERIHQRGAGFELVVGGPPGGLRVSAEPAQPGRASFRVIGPYAFSYGVTPSAPDAATVALLDVVLRQLGPALARVAPPRVSLPVVR